MSSNTRWQGLMVIIGAFAVFYWRLDPFTGQMELLQKQIDAITDAGALQSAIKSYNTDYGHYPLPDKSPSLLDQRTETKEPLMSCLLGMNPDGLNPREREYFPPSFIRGWEQRLRKTPGESSLHDPWGHPYRVIMDTDASQTVEVPSLKRLHTAHSQAVPLMADTRVLVYSLGPDGQEGTSDDLNSWVTPLRPRAEWNLLWEQLAVKALLAACIATGGFCLLLLVKRAVWKFVLPS